MSPARARAPSSRLPAPAPLAPARLRRLLRAGGRGTQSRHSGGSQLSSAFASLGAGSSHNHGNGGWSAVSRQAVGGRRAPRQAGEGGRGPPLPPHPRARVPSLRLAPALAQPGCVGLSAGGSLSPANPGRGGAWVCSWRRLLSRPFKEAQHLRWVLPGRKSLLAATSDPSGSALQNLGSPLLLLSQSVPPTLGSPFWHPPSVPPLSSGHNVWSPRRRACSHPPGNPRAGGSDAALSPAPPGSAGQGLLPSLAPVPPQAPGGPPKA